MTTVSEIAPDVFRISTFVKEFDLQFNQFLVRDEEPLPFHTGPRAMFAAVRESVATLLDPSKVKWIGFSHLEADECGSLHEWQQLAPESMAVCSLVGKLVSIDDFMTMRPAKGMQDGEVLTTGTYRFRFLHTPHVPHCWEAGLLFEETRRQVLVEYQQGPLANYMPYSTLTEPTIHRLAGLQPKTLATMHGSAYIGDGSRALRDLANIFKEVLGPTS